MNHLKSYKTLFILILVGLLLNPATAQRRRQGGQRGNGLMRGPQQQVRRAAPRPQVRRATPRPRMQRSTPRRQVRRSAPRQQVRRSAPRRQVQRAVRRSAPKRQRTFTRNTNNNQRRTFNRNQNRQRNVNRQRFTNRVRQNSNQRQTFVRNNRNTRQNNQRVVRQQQNQRQFTRQVNSGRRNQNVVRDHNRRRQQRIVRQNSGNQNKFIRNAGTGRRHQNRQNFTNRPTTTYINNTRPVRRPVTVGNTYNVNRNVVVNQPGCAPVYTSTYNPVIYTNYSARRRYRRSFYRSCPITFLSLGFFLTRPYSYYDYARVGYNYNTPYYYGDENYYRPNPYTQGGPNPQQQPVADANTSDQVAAAMPSSAQSSEHQMLAVLSEFVDGRSKDGRYQVKDAAFNNQTWQLELSQAPAVYEISDGKYSVVAGFEGTLGASSVPSQVTVEFFMVKAGTGYAVRDAWITNANGIARNKLYQSPDFPSVQTWQPGKMCPFSGKPMVEISPQTETKPQPEHG